VVVRFDLESSKAPAVMSKDSRERLDMLGTNNSPNAIEKAVLEAVTKRRRICVHRDFALTKGRNGLRDLPRSTSPGETASAIGQG
jgi:hypothetical protein